MLFPITSSQYAKDFKRIVQSPKFNHSEYLVVLSLLIAGKPLPAKYSNHPLSGSYQNFGIVILRTIAYLSTELLTMNYFWLGLAHTLKYSKSNSFLNHCRA